MKEHAITRHDIHRIANEIATHTEKNYPAGSKIRLAVISTLNCFAAGLLDTLLAKTELPKPVEILVAFNQEKPAEPAEPAAPKPETDGAL